MHKPKSSGLNRQPLNAMSTDKMNRAGGNRAEIIIKRLLCPRRKLASPKSSGARSSHAHRGPRAAALINSRDSRIINRASPLTRQRRAVPIAFSARAVQAIHRVHSCLSLSLDFLNPDDLFMLIHPGAPRVARSARARTAARLRSSSRPRGYL